jgi:cobalt-zinc-cadmium efflux system membrane fusion protein
VKDNPIFPERALLRVTASTLASLTLLLTTGCEKASPPVPAEKSGGAPASAQPARIQQAQKQFLTIETAGSAKDTDVISLPGRVAFRPQAQSAIGAPAAGRVSRLLVRAGEAVKAGAPLLTIESADAAGTRASLDQAATRLATAESVYKRNVEMMERGVGLEVERQEAAARLKEARAEDARARQAAGIIGGGQGSLITVRAPSDGVVMAIRVAAGASVAPGGEPLIELGDPSRLQVVAQVPESDLRRIAAGQEAEVELPALSARAAGKVENVSPRVETDSRRGQVYLALAKSPEGMRAGMLAQIALRVGAEAGIALPVSAVLIKDGRRRVVYVERPDGTFEAREVQVGHVRDGHVVIMQGLKPGEKVVVRGALLLDAQAEQLL